MSEYDVLIVGSGLAGLTAALFSARYGLSTLVIESNTPGGHLISIEKIEDFPGCVDGIPGYELCPAVQREAGNHGAEFQRSEVKKLDAKNRFWSVMTDDKQEHLAKTVIIATGSTLKELGVPGEARLIGHGVSHCASCDGPLYNGQTVGVVGGGDSALQEALTLSNFAASVLVFNRDDSFSGQHCYIQRISQDTKIASRHRTIIEEVLGDDVVSGVRVRNLRNHEVSQIDLAGLFVYVGMKPNTALLKDVLELSETGHVPTNGWMKTARDGLYAAGDIRQDSASQAITAAGDGATAAVAAYRYIQASFPR